MMYFPTQTKVALNWDTENLVICLLMLAGYTVTKADAEHSWIVETSTRVIRITFHSTLAWMVMRYKDDNSVFIGAARKMYRFYEDYDGKMLTTGYLDDESDTSYLTFSL